MIANAGNSSANAKSVNMSKGEGTGELNDAHRALHQKSIVVGPDSPTVQGCDMDTLVRASLATAQGGSSEAETAAAAVDRLSLLLEAFRTTGFQATTLAQAIEQVNAMRAWKPSVATVSLPKECEGAAAAAAAAAMATATAEGTNMTVEPNHDDAAAVVDEDPSRAYCKIFLGYTSNQVSCGNRDIIRWLVQHKMVHVLVTTAGGIEEDFIKCLRPLVIGDWKLDGRALRSQGLNRIGNLLMPNENYCAFEDWLMPILDRLVIEQNEQGVRWTPSRLIDRLGAEINDERSIYYWAHKNGIPVFCPAITDGSIGDMLFFHSYKQEAEKQLILDLVQDVRALNLEAIRAGATGILCLGGGVVKHHICNANLMRNGAEFAVFINTGQEFDGSDSGASPDEAVSWGKIKGTANPVKVCCDASLAFPLLVAETFAADQSIREGQLRVQRALHDHLYI